MAPPTNIDAASATELGPLPNSIAQRVDDAGTTYTVWFKVTNADAGVIGPMAFGDLVTYRPSLQIFESDGTTRVVNNNLGSSPNKRMLFPSVGSTYYFKVIPNSGNPSPANLTISADYFTELDPIPVPGSLLVNQDTDGMPAVVMNAAGVVRKFIQPMANGEGGAILPNGRFLLTRDDEQGATNGTATIYAPDGLTEIATFAYNADTGNALLIPTGASDTYFYVLDTNLSPYILQRVDEDGNIISNVWHLTFSITGIAPSRDDTILYYNNSATPTVIKRWDLVGNVAMSDLATLPAGFHAEFGNLLVLSDGSILIGANHLAATVAQKVFRYDAAGTLLATYDVTDATKRINRLALNTDDTSDSVWIWSRLFGTGVSRFEEYDITAAGSVISTFDIVEYESGVYLGTATATPVDDWGPPFSCPFLVLRAAPAGTIIVTKVNTRHDATSFDFTATNLTPNTFSLADTDNQTYTDVPVGDGYGIAEDPITGWTTTYDVSNDSPVDNISVAADETVTVTVTNNPPGEIVVVKVNSIVNDETVFDFSATNLTPTTFTLTGITPDDTTTFSDVPAGDGYVISETVPTGWTATYDVSNDSPHTNLSVAPDETVTVTVTNAPVSNGTSEPVRRMRQFTIPSVENFWIFIQKLELEFQRGQGTVTGQGSDPQIMFQLSRNGGKTWEPERWTSAGALGEYQKRAIFRKLGRARNPVARIIVSDPVFWAFQDAYFDGIQGTS